MTDAPIVLDCTIRDGSYAIDFKFTAADTALIAGLLDDAGLRYIEVGHGLGLGASEAGKGRAPSRDSHVIRMSVERAPNARIGAFFIPGIGTPDDLRAAADAGMHFVRVGHNADEIDGAWPTVDLARELGLEVFVNLMKTYGISLEAMAAAAAGTYEHGGRGIYVVDSAGGMLPSEVAAFTQAAREGGPELDVGFHGHSNLHLAVANALAAMDAGARFVDTSVYGIGRSSGNVPTEVFAVVLERLGIDAGIDAPKIIDMAETYLKPLAEHLHPHDMTAVSLGYGRFHSSYLPRAFALAAEHGVDPLRFIVAVGKRDMMRMEDETIRSALDEVRDSRPAATRPDLARFSDERFGPRRIGNRPEVVGELLDDLEVAAAKRQMALVVDLAISSALDEDDVTAEFVGEDDFAAIGRIRAGSADALARALGGESERIDLALLAADRLSADEAAGALRRLVPLLRGDVALYRATDLVLAHLGDVALAYAAAHPGEEILLCDPGWFPAADVDALAGRLAAAAPLARCGQAPPEGDAGAIVVAGPLEAVRTTEAQTFRTAIGLGGPHAPEWAEHIIGIGPADPYRNRLPLWRAAVAATRAAAGAPTEAL